MKIHREGYRIILSAFIIVTLLNALAAYYIPEKEYLRLFIGITSFLILVLTINFFRNPKRSYTGDDNLIIAAADGKIVVIEEVEESEYFRDQRIQVSIFMSPTNVHINRNPISGKVSYVKYHPGKYLVAWHPKSSKENERNTIVIEHDDIEVLVRQIAGKLARRIVNYLSIGEEAVQGAEFGFIKFGSRVDIFLPTNSIVEVELNQKVKGGKTIIARLS